jgi:hypothetical protein
LSNWRKSPRAGVEKKFSEENFIRDQYLRNGVAIFSTPISTTLTRYHNRAIFVLVVPKQFKQRRSEK